jgi:prevent-host-death family protein
MCLTIVTTMVMKGKASTVHPAGEFKTHCLRLMEEVARTGVAITVSKRGKPLVRIVPVEAEELDRVAWREKGRTSLVLPDDEVLLRPTGERWEAEG